MAEVERFLDGGCTDARRKTCKANNGEYLAAVCAECELNNYEPSQYVVSLVDTVLLVEAGFPFVADDFTMAFWKDLGRVRMAVKQRANPF